MGQAKLRGSYEDRAATPQGYIKINRNSEGQFKKSRENLIHVSVFFSKQMKNGAYLRAVAPMRYQPHVDRSRLQPA